MWHKEKHATCQCQHNVSTNKKITGTVNLIQNNCNKQIQWQCYKLIQESPADAGIPARRKNDKKNSDDDDDDDDDFSFTSLCHITDD